MTLEEQKAFVEAYSRNMAYVSADKVADFVSRYDAGEDMDYSGDYTSIMDALGVWHEAVRWGITK
jgi:hypothetical protein